MKNLKAILMTGLAITTSLGAMAIPAKRGLRTYTQSDGTQISVMLVGDEHFHTYLTSDGLSVVRDSIGDFYYSKTNGSSSVRAHDPESRNEAELNFLQREAKSISLEELVSKNRERIAGRRVNTASTRASSEPEVANNGSPRVPILLVEYQDKRFKDSDPIKTFKKFFAEGENSAFQYFADQSNGKFTPQFDLYGPYTLSEQREYYGGNNAFGSDKNLGNMVAEGALGLDSDIDYSLYDNNGDGECDVLIVLYAGDGEASSTDPDAQNAIWPAQWTLSASDYGKALLLDDIKVNKFAVFNELNGEDLNKIAGIGTFCHEFSHCLGLPDFYDTNYVFYGMGPWSLMDSGSYNNDSYTPVGYSAYEKAFMGWIDIEEGRANREYTLPVLNQKNVETDKAVKLTNPLDENEYFILENRQRQGWDEYIPADGMLITHVTYSKNSWDTNTVNNYNMQRMTPVPADNRLKQTEYGFDASDARGDLWPYNGNDAFTDSSSPSQRVNTGDKLGKPVTEISLNDDGTVSFWLMKGMAAKLFTPEVKDIVIGSPVSATLNWDADLECDATFTIELKERDRNSPDLISHTVFDNNEHGWGIDEYGAVEEDGLRLGSSRQGGCATSPEFECGDSGKVSVVFNAKSYNNDVAAAIVTVKSGGEALEELTIPLTAESQDYEVVLQGKANENNAVSISIEGPKKRIYVSMVDIYNGDTKAYGGITGEGGEAILIEGVEGMSHTLSNLKEGGLYEYRIKAVPRGTEDFLESDWTSKNTFDLSKYDPSAIFEIIEQENTPAEYYTLQGTKIAKPTTPGVYIVKRGSRVAKIAL
ncbi:MAG: M6 family metalloprotease domain-containing protein [Bacteroides sp.]|nr:M6 family metalloprotease domain-containing protein [Bacteroides sp.]